MRIRNHIRANVVGYLALFFAISTGTAVATHPGGANTISSGDIINGEVTQPDIAAEAVGTDQIKNNQVRSPDIKNGEVGTDDVLDGGIGTADLADGSVNSAKVLDDSLGAGDLATSSVGQSEIATDGVAALEIQDNSIDSGEIVDFSLTNQDVGVLFAEVSGAAALDNSSGGGVTATRVGAVGSGNYEVDFARNVTACTSVATIGPSGAGSANGDVNVADRSGNVEAIFVDTNDASGVAADRPFRLVVVC